MGQTVTTTNTRPVDLESLRLQLEEDGKLFYDNRDSEEAHERLLHTLQTYDCREIITAIADGDDLANTFLCAAFRSNVDILEAFLHHGMNIDIKDKSDLSALMYASCDGNEECVRFLLDQNANPDIQDNSGWTALMIASFESYKEAVQLLLNHGVDIDLKNNEGKTAFDIADEEEIKEMIRNHVNTCYVLK